MRSFIIIAIVFMSACENKVEGPKGDQGIQGVAGEKGDKGEPGEKGEEGSKGDQGATGLQGEKGLQGIAGEKGETGSIGLAVVQGAKGDPGSIGLPGSDGTSCVGQSVTEGVLVTCGNETFLVKHGDVGPAGAKGDKGDAGSQGLKGDQGLQGIQGVTGKNSTPGLDGLPGAKGDVGSQGLQGIQGDKGDAGSKGSPGWDGIPGLKGDKGNQGEQGLQGIQGPQGVQGKPGELGKNLVAQCPEGSKAMVFKGHLKYCAHKFVFEKGLTWEQCLNTCLTNGLLIPPLHEFAIICLGDPTFFDQEKVNGCPDFPNCSTITGCPSDYSLENLRRIVLVKARHRNRKKYYKLDAEFSFYAELKGIFAKEIQADSPIVGSLKKLPSVKLALLAGSFVGTESKVDLLIVGELKKEMLEALLLQDPHLKNVRYSIFSEADFLYSLSLKDKFITEIVSDPRHMMVVNNLTKEMEEARK